MNESIPGYALKFKVLEFANHYAKCYNTPVYVKRGVYWYIWDAEPSL